MTPRERAEAAIDEAVVNISVGERVRLRDTITTAITEAVAAALAAPLPTPMTDADLAEARRLVEAASDPPWVATWYDRSNTNYPHWGVDCSPPDVLSVANVHNGFGGEGEAEANAAFIAAAPTLVRRLLDTVTTLTGLLRDLGQDGAISQYQAGRLAGLREAVEVALAERRQWTINGGALSACDSIETRLNALIREFTHAQ